MSSTALRRPLRSSVSPLSHTVGYAYAHRFMRVMSRMPLDEAEFRARTFHALLRTQPGYERAASGKNKKRVRWFLLTVPRLSADLVVLHLPPGVIGAVLLLRSVLPPKCTALPHCTIDQLCILALELAPLVVEMASDN
jgi:hypothetical protein